MPAVPPSRILRHLRRVALRQAASGLEDAQLLERFLAERDEAAFEALVRRHGPMVFGVCRRVLGQRHDAEDAFQATFLVLACKAGSVRKRGAVGSWLYGVAYRTAGKARLRQARRRVKEREAAVTEARNDNPAHDDLARLLDLELNRLPDKYRAPVLLCDLEGASRKEAARRLGLPEGTLSSRLATAHSKLAKRLTRRGLALASGGLSAVLAENVASASVPALLIGSTVHAAARVAAGQAVTAATSASVASLAKGVMNTMFMSQLKIPLGVVLAVGFVTLGWGAYHGTRAAEDPPPAKELAKAPAPEAPAKDDSVDDDIDLPVGTPLTQVRARVDKNGKLIIKTMIRGGSRFPLATGGNNGFGDAFPEPEVTTIQIQRLDLADVKVVDVKGKKVEESELIKLLKKETVAMASLHGEPVDPLHLRVLKEGTLVIALPAPRAPTGAGMMGGPTGSGTGANPYGNLPGKVGGARPGNGSPPSGDSQGR
jgi:RNA polymerase sigma factor (sigma-70 family)